MQTRWKYMVVKFTTFGFLGGRVDEVAMGERLDQLGAEGWEVVSCVGSAQSHGRTREIVAVLKRPV